MDSAQWIMENGQWVLLVISAYADVSTIAGHFNVGARRSVQAETETGNNILVHKPALSHRFMQIVSAPI